MSNLLNEINEDIKKINDAREAMLEKLRPRLKEIFIPFFEKYPEVKFIGWPQYTPFFNDGDACEFRVNPLVLSTNEDGVDCFYEGEGDLPYKSCVRDYEAGKASDWATTEVEKAISVFGNLQRVKECMNDFEGLQKSFQNIPEDILKELFGDHASVSVSRDGIDVEEFDHD